MHAAEFGASRPACWVVVSSSWRKEGGLVVEEQPRFVKLTRYGIILYPLVHHRRLSSIATATPQDALSTQLSLMCKFKSFVLIQSSFTLRPCHRIDNQQLFFGILAKLYRHVLTTPFQGVTYHTYAHMHAYTGNNYSRTMLLLSEKLRALMTSAKQVRVMLPPALE
jgi:hypothetical protein